MPRNYSIKWRERDLSELKRVIKNFNAKIARVLKKDPSAAVYLPQRVQFKEAKTSIETRADYNKYIKSLMRFSRKGSEKMVVGAGGVVTTKWEKKEVGIKLGIVNQRRARLRKRLEPSTQKGTMGTIRERELDKKPFNFEKKSQKDWEKFKESVEKQARSTYERGKAEQYLKNYGVAADRWMGIMAPLVKYMAEKMGAQALYDIYADEPILQIDYEYSQQNVEFKMGRMLDKFYEQGVILTEAEQKEWFLTFDLAKRYSTHYGKGENLEVGM